MSKQWRSRWFVLDSKSQYGQTLFYYESKMAYLSNTPAKGCIFMTGAKLEHYDNAKYKNNCFGITAAFEDRTFILAADQMDKVYKRY